MKLSRLVSISSVALASSCTAFAQAPPNFTARLLGTLGGQNSLPTGINNAGQITGEADTVSGYGHAFLYSGGVMNDLGTLGGNNSYGRGLNNFGVVVGTSWLANGTTEDAFQSGSGGLTDITAKLGVDNVPSSINDAGQIAGNDTQQAFFYSNGVLTEFGSLGVFSNSTAYAMNQAGQVTGTGWLKGKPDAYLFSNGALTNLGTLGGTGSEGFGINASGEVTGDVTTADLQSLGFIYANGQMTTLATLGGRYGGALGINDAGEIVGQTGYADPLSSQVACLYWNGTPYDLNTLVSGNLTFPLQSANYINDSNEILAVDTESNWYVLTPAPEPTTWGAIVLSAAILVKRRRIC